MLHVAFMCMRLEDVNATGLADNHLYPLLRAQHMPRHLYHMA